LKLTIVAVGKLKERHYQLACDEYLKRLRRHLPCEVVEVRDAAALAARAPARAERWALDEAGRELSSDELATTIGKRMAAGSQGIAFLIGGADGIPAETVRACAVRWSLSRLTLPHRLARLVVCEQLYRALSIVRGEPYHRA
jgi:23S rRNA (pseudouridine1915-N3)-methyltransferase